MPPAAAEAASQKRKKWTEEEERTLLERYAEMSAEGLLTRLLTREKRFRPIAAHVNSLHHLSDPSSFPFLWSWKDVSTKVQNMRHQYSLVKQKLRSSSPPLDPLALWPNFLRYRRVFGDPPDDLPPPAADEGDGGRRRRRKGERAWAIVRDQIASLREREQRLAEAEARTMDEDRERRRRFREEEREWEERQERRRVEWRRRVDGVVAQHRAEMEQIQARMAQEQQAVLGQLLAMVGGAGVGDGAGVAGGHPHHHHLLPTLGQHLHHGHPYFSQVAQGFEHHVVGGMEHGEHTAAGDSQEDDQFIVDDGDDA